MKALKIFLTIIWVILVITAFVIAIYFLTNGGFNELVDLTKDGGNFWEGFKQFWVNIWEGIKAIFAK